MKPALINFPPDVPDDRVDRAMREAARVAAGEDAEDAHKAEIADLMGEIAQHGEDRNVSLESLAKSADNTARQIRTIADTLKSLDASASGLSKDAKELGAKIDALTRAIEGAAERIVTAMSAPRTIVKDKAGKPVGLKIGD